MLGISISMSEIVLQIYKRYQSEHEKLVIGVSPHKVPSFPKLPEFKMETLGVDIRDFLKEINNYYNSITTDKVILSETRGLSGTKNEELRETLFIMGKLTNDLYVECDKYIDKCIIDSKLLKSAIDPDTAKKIIESNSDGMIDRVSLFRLRSCKDPEVMPMINEFIHLQKSKMFGLESKHILFPMNRYSIIPGNPIMSDKSTIINDGGNIIIISRSSPGYYFKTVDPRREDVTVPMNVDFINRTRVLVSVTAEGDTDSHTVILPKKGGVVTMYETFDYKTFIPLLYDGVSKSIMYSYAISYYCAMTGNDHDDCLPMIHEGINNVYNEIFDSNYNRKDLEILAKEFKFGKGMQDIIKSAIKESLLKKIDEGVSAKEIDIAEIIRLSVNSVIKDISRESAISSYIGILRLIAEFSKEYQIAIAKANWESHPRIAMIDVYNQCSAKCDKVNVWSIDFRSPKDLFWK